MDKIEWAHNLFFEYQSDSEDPNQKIIIPFEMELNFFAALRQGAGSRFGPNQELATEWLWPFRIEMKPCQVISMSGDPYVKVRDVNSTKDESAKAICSP